MLWVWMHVYWRWNYVLTWDLVSTWSVTTVREQYVKCRVVPSVDTYLNQTVTINDIVVVVVVDILVSLLVAKVQCAAYKRRVTSSSTRLQQVTGVEAAVWWRIIPQWCSRLQHCKQLRFWCRQQMWLKLWQYSSIGISHNKASTWIAVQYHTCNIKKHLM